MASQPPPLDWERVALLPGRDIIASPEWDADAPSLLFDRNSGDYWVVSSAARRIVLAIGRGPAALDSLQQELDGRCDLPSVIDELVRRGILTHT